MRRLATNEKVMRIKKEYKLQSIAGKNFVFLRNDGQVDMTRIISLNASAAWLWTQVENSDFTEDSALQLLKQHYEGNSEEMAQNVATWVETLRKNDFIED